MIEMKKFVFVFLFFIKVISVHSQQKVTAGEIMVKVTSETLVPLQGAVIELMQKENAHLIKTALTDSVGSALFEHVPAASYYIKASMVGHEGYVSDMFTVSPDSGLRTPAIVMVPKKDNTLQGVTVTAAKPFIQRLNDRLVVNVQNSILSAGATALEVLERSPGVSVDNESISLRGKAGVIIMIDGKITPMSSKDLANYLSNLPSSSLDRIEIITNPSARYDASGNAGIIDVRLKKDQKLGANGIVTASIGKSKYDRGAISSSFNYRSKWLNVYGDHSYNYRKSFNHVTSSISFYKNALYKGGYEQDNFTVRNSKSNALRIGADIYVSKHTNVGIALSSNRNIGDRVNNLVSQVFDSSRGYEGEIQTKGSDQSGFNSTTYGLNMKHQFKETGKELTADYDYASYSANNRPFLHTGYTMPINDNKLKGLQYNTISLSSFKADYSQQLTKTIKFEVGIKSSIVKIDNDQDFYNLSTGYVYDSALSNRFFYTEKISAAYINGNKGFKKFSLQAGLRAEQIHLSGNQEAGKVTFDSTYTQLFPSIFLNYKLNANQSIGISVSRRIERPSYAQLNPFRTILDPTLVATGNPYLLPQLSWSYELNYKSV
jgi:outer membrane receptor protein involved in Fe transport